jgi:hypothetical protein
MVELQGTLTFGDLLCFSYFHQLRRIWPLVVGLFFAFTIVLGIVLLDPTRIDSMRLPLVVMAAIVVFLVGCPYVSARKQFARPVFRDTMRHTFSPDGIQSKATGILSEVQWGILYEVRETKRLFLVYYASNMALIIPKRFFINQAEIESWKKIALTGIAPKQIAEPGFVGLWC